MKTKNFMSLQNEVLELLDNESMAMMPALSTRSTSRWMST